VHRAAREIRDFRRLVTAINRPASGTQLLHRFAWKEVLCLELRLTANNASFRWNGLIGLKDADYVLSFPSTE
jgi:hypothetical protein